MKSARQIWLKTKFYMLLYTLLAQVVSLEEELIVY